MQHKAPHHSLRRSRSIAASPTTPHSRVGEQGMADRRRPALADFRKDVVVELYNEAGQLVKRYKVYRCWPSRYVALPDLDANSSGVALETLVLENEGWERTSRLSSRWSPRCEKSYGGNVSQASPSSAARCRRGAPRARRDAQTGRVVFFRRDHGSPFRERRKPYSAGR